MPQFQMCVVVLHFDYAQNPKYDKGEDWSKKLLACSLFLYS